MLKEEYQWLRCDSVKILYEEIYMLHLNVMASFAYLKSYQAYYFSVYFLLYAHNSIAHVPSRIHAHACYIHAEGLARQCF